MVQPRDWFSPIAYLTQNRVSLAGVALATSAATFWLFLLPAGDANPYLGLVTFALLPAVLLLGLFLIPLGLWLQRRAGATAQPRDPRQLLLFLGLVTIANLGIASTVGYKAVHKMDSVEFCGQTCHSVMKPEFVAYHYSSHSKVDCVKCHVGSGAEGYLKAKLNGLHQMISLITDKYHRPIPTPIKGLPAADQTCESCHSRAVLMARGDRLRVFTHFDEDSASSPKYSALLMKIGRIHSTHFKSKRAELKDVSCLTCHNRPAHTFESPEDAVDHAIAGGLISRGTPFARKNAVAALRAAKSVSDLKDKALADIFARNVFPEMGIGWGTYINRLGHADEKNGCYRCHDGAKLTQDCNACHGLISMEEADPKVLKDLGYF